MKFTLQPLIVTGLASIVLAGCSSPASQSSPEFVCDPLGIDRAVNEYYFSNGVPPANGGADPARTDDNAGCAVDSPVADDLP